MDIIKLFLFLIVVIVSCNAEDIVKNRVKRWKSHRHHSTQERQWRIQYNPHHIRHRVSGDNMYWREKPIPHQTWGSHHHHNHRHDWRQANRHSQHHWNKRYENPWYRSCNTDIPIVAKPIETTTTTKPIVEIIPQKPFIPVMVVTPKEFIEPITETSTKQSSVGLNNPWVQIGFSSNHGNPIVEPKEHDTPTIETSTTEHTNVEYGEEQQSIASDTTTEDINFEQFDLNSHTETEHINLTEFIDFSNTKLPRNTTIQEETKTEKSEISKDMTSRSEEKIDIDERWQQNSEEVQTEYYPILTNAEDANETVSSTENPFVVLVTSNEKNYLSISTVSSNNFDTTTPTSSEEYISTTFSNPMESFDFVVENIPSNEEQTENGPDDFPYEYNPVESTA